METGDSRQTSGYTAEIKYGIWQIDFLQDIYSFKRQSICDVGLETLRRNDNSFSFDLVQSSSDRLSEDKNE